MWRTLQNFLGPQGARELVFACPYLLTKRGYDSSKVLPALLNVFGTRKRLREVVLTSPGMVHSPLGSFYRGFPSMIAVAGNPEKALEVGKEAMERIERSPQKKVVPEGYPALIAIFGGLKEAHKAIDAQPRLLTHYGEQFLGKLLSLRRILGKEGAREALKKAPYLLLKEDQRKTVKFKNAWKGMKMIFGPEEARRRLEEKPELLAIGTSLERALGFAVKKLGSTEEVAKNFDSVLRRTGLQNHIDTWEVKQRPRFGYWTPKTGKALGMGYNPSPWAPSMSPTGPSGPARGQWDEVPEEDPNVVEAEEVQAARGGEKVESASVSAH